MTHDFNFSACFVCFCNHFWLGLTISEEITENINFSLLSDAAFLCMVVCASAGRLTADLIIGFPVGASLAG